MRWPTDPVIVTAPASSANLGPGFDSLGLALSLHDTLEARVVHGATSVDVYGLWPGASAAAAATEDNLILRAMTAGFAAFAGRQPPALGLSCRTEIPQGFGLGSSAAAIVAGLLAARELSARRAAGPARAAVPGDEAVLQLAADIEGHPDNVAACLYGGLTISWTAGARVRAARLTPLPDVAPVLCVPASPVLTETARKALPLQVPHADAAANAARAALLVTALTSRPGLLLDGTEDFLHQGYRADAMPATAELVSRLRAAGVAAVISGAGPAVLALTVNGGEAGPARVASVVAGVRSPWRVMPLRVDSDGARVVAG